MGTGGGECDGTALSPAEVREAIEAVTDHDKTALVKVARLYAPKTPYGPRDLLHEAMCRLLKGERTWPRGMPAVQVLWGVMKSIAWQWRRKDVPSGDAGFADGAATGRAFFGPAPQESTVFLKQFIALFDDDPVAKAVLLACMAGEKGEELLLVIDAILNDAANIQARGGMRATEAEIKTAYERVLRKIRRRREKYQREA